MIKKTRIVVFSVIVVSIIFTWHVAVFAAPGETLKERAAKSGNNTASLTDVERMMGLGAAATMAIAAEEGLAFPLSKTELAALIERGVANARQDIEKRKRAGEKLTDTDKLVLRSENELLAGAFHVMEIFNTTAAKSEDGFLMKRGLGEKERPQFNQTNIMGFGVAATIKRAVKEGTTFPVDISELDGLIERALTSIKQEVREKRMRGEQLTVMDEMAFGEDAVLSAVTLPAFVIFNNMADELGGGLKFSNKGKIK